jgi:peptide/nickel transport system substrate-binding protein
MGTSAGGYGPRKMSRRRFLGMGAAGAGLFLAGCGGAQYGGQQGGGGGGGGEFHSAYPYQMPPSGHFNTFDLINAITMDFYWDMMETPMAIYMWADDRYEPLMATEWGFEGSDTFRVTLREGAQWSDGAEFTSRDVLTTFDMLRLQSQVIWDYLSSVEADGDYGVVFTMKDPSTVVERYVLRERIRADATYGRFTEQARDLFERNVDPDSEEFRAVRTEFEEFRPEEMIVSGPFQVDRESMTESQLTMNKIDTAWNADTVRFDRVINYNGETPAVTPIVLSKDIDYATHGFPIATEKSFEEQGIRILRPPTYSGPALYFNYATVKAVADPRVRQAIAMAVNMEENAVVSLAESAKKSRYMTGVSDNIINAWVSEADLSNMNPYDHDPDAATQMMEDLGFTKEDDVWVSPDGERMEYELGAPAEFADWSAAAKNLADQLTKFGIKTTVRTITFTQWEPRVQNGDFELGIQAWGQANPHPHFSYVQDLFTFNTPLASGAGMDYDLTQQTESVGQVDLERLTIQSASGLNTEDHKETVTTLAKAFNELLPIIPLWERYGNNPALEGERVTGWPGEDDPIYENSPYEDNFVVAMILDGTLKPV